METEPAPAKVNLYLHVLGRREDGYHLLDSLAVFAGVGDLLHAEPADALTLELRGPFAGGLAAEAENLVLRAARGLAQEAGVPPRTRLVLDKRLPVASGIGGGSADAAAALRLLSRLWAVRPADADLHRLAATLGADVPACLASRPVRMGGVGEVLGVAPGLPECGLVLVNPGVPVATPEVFRRRTGPFSAPAELPASWPDTAGLATGLARLHNDLQAPAIQACPAIGSALAWLRGHPSCLLARMSGSGATCFGLFCSSGDAGAAATGAPSGWWCWGGAMACPAPTPSGPFTPAPPAPIA